MASKVTIGQNTFNAPKQANELGQGWQKDSKTYNYAVTYNSLTGAGLFSYAFGLLTRLVLPKPAYLRGIYINGYYVDTANSSLKLSQPFIGVGLGIQFLSGSLNQAPTDYTLAISATLNSQIYFGGILNNMPIEYKSKIYIPAGTILTLDGTASFTAATLGLDAILIDCRLEFET